MTELQFLTQFNLQLLRSNMAYQHYLDNGQAFLYAKVLKRSNEELRSLIIDHSHVAPITFQENLAALVFHLDVWCELWDNLFDVQQPSFDDAFVFENSVTFPREAVNDILSYYQTKFST